MTSTTVTDLYICIWSICQLLPTADHLLFGYGGHGGLDARPTVGLVDWTLQPFLLVATLIALWRVPRISKTLCMVAHAVDLAIRLWRMPYVWDHEQWALLFQLSFLVCSGMGEDVFLQTCRQQFAILYAGATFWKLNPSFVNPSTSCGTVVIVEFLAAHLSWFPPLAARVAPWSPLMTLLVEGLLALLFNYSSSRHKHCRLAAILLGCVFHWSIFVMPVNAAGGFSMDCVSRYILLFTTEEVQRVVGDGWKSTYAIALATAFAVLIPLRSGVTNNEPLDFCYLGFCSLMVLYGLLLWENALPEKQEDASSTPNKSSSMTSKVIWGITFAHAFLFTILGVEQMGAPTMFSNLNYYGGGNHYLVPIGILGDDLLHGGGLVKVHRSTSSRLNEHLGYIRSDLLWSDAALTAMRNGAGVDTHVVQYMALVMRNEPARSYCGDLYQQSNPKGSSNHVPFLIPLSVVNKALREEKEAAFEVHLSDANDENSGRLLTGDGACFEMDSRGRRRRRCLEDDVLVQRLLDPNLRRNFVHWFIDKLLSPYPQLLDRNDEEVCMT